MYKEHLRHFWNIHATKNRMHVLSCSCCRMHTDVCMCVDSNVAWAFKKHRRHRVVEVLFWFRPPYWSSLPLGSIGPSGIWRCYARPLWVWLQNEAKWIGIHMNTWTHGNSTSCVLLFPSTMRSCECPERWPIPARRSRTELTHSCHLLIRCLSGDSTSREAMDWRMHLWFRGAGGREAYFFSAGPGMMKKSSSGSVYFSSLVHHVSSKFDEFGVSMIWCWQLADLCFVCQKNLRESNSPCSSQISTSEHPDVQTNYIWHYRTWYYDIIYDYFILYIQCNNCSFHLRNKDNKACPSWKFLRCHMVSPSNVPVTSVSHLQQQIQTAVAKTQTAGVGSIELQRRAGPQCLRLDVVFLMRKKSSVWVPLEKCQSHIWGKGTIWKTGNGALTPLKSAGFLR